MVFRNCGYDLDDTVIKTVTFYHKNFVSVVQRRAIIRLDIAVILYIIIIDDLFTHYHSMQKWLLDLLILVIV